MPPTLESDLAAIWAELLDLDPASIAPDATFLRLGGDSVLAVRMSALVRRRLAVELALADVTVEISLAALTDLVRDRASGDGAGARALPVEIVRRPDPSAPFPLMPLQQGYFVGQHDGWELSYASAHFYGDLALSRMDADEAAETLADALHRLALHQPTLRARITPEGEQYVLPPDAPGAIPGPRVLDLRDAADAEIAAALAATRAEMSTSGPNPLTGPGVDVRLTLLPGGRGRLHTAMSLIAMDGWSATVLNRELLTLATDWNAVPAPLEVDFGDYVAAIERLRHTGAWQADRDWWHDRLDAFPPPPALPLLADPRDVAPDLMDTRDARLAADRWTALKRRCAEHDVTPSAAMLTAFAVVLARWAGHRAMLLNTLQLNRLPLHPDIHRTIGAFAATMLVPVDLDGAAAFSDLVRAQQRTFTEHAAHNLVTGVEVSRELARRRGTVRPVAPIVFQSTLGMDAAIGQRQATAAGPLGELDFGDFYHQLRTPQVALEARFWEMNDEMAVAFSLVGELFDPSEVDYAFAELVELIGALADGYGWDRVLPLPDAARPGPADGHGRDRALALPDAAYPGPAEGLRVGDEPRAEAAVAPGPPRDELEQRIAALWEDLLDAPVLDRAETFFALGGDSLLAVRAVARLAKETGRAVGVRRFLDVPTVAGLADAVREGTA
ncbi:phosphopantetheine-binding protein [Actinomadura flavalba]|uniref:phosphopantetheine-binding protein n=1 Tax=Actinomadura flavalba TaxID=1120938 RepID=UPI00039C3477|nr:phosphopantetheine-binding protein [Actinomadura flavalba]